MSGSQDILLLVFLMIAGWFLPDLVNLLRKKPAMKVTHIETKYVGREGWEYLYAVEHRGATYIVQLSQYIGFGVRLQRIVPMNEHTPALGWFAHRKAYNLALDQLYADRERKADEKLRNQVLEKRVKQ